MAVINYSKKEISAKIVYYGPSLCGKTTNIQSIYASLKPDQKGKLVSLATEADRTLFFDFLPVEIANIRGFKTRLHFYTVPGQVYYNSTRRAVLTGVDGLVFVADSQRDKMEENIESLNNLEENLNYYGKSIKTIPIVIQYNKRDLADVTSVAEMEQMINPYGYPSFESVATTGEGVLDTLTKITKMVLQHIEMGTSGKQPRNQSAVAEKPSVSPGLSQTGLSSQGPPQQGLFESGIPRTGISPQSGLSQPTPSPKEQEPSPERHMEPALDVSGYDKPEPSVTGTMPKSSAGRIQIVGTDNAEIISSNAISVPIRVKIEGDMKVYRIDLAIKLDGFKPED
jgi:signal recognition particle receptor subunit beta